MKPIIFGSGERQLYGVYHPAPAGKRQKSAVLLCYPHVAEYNFVHRAFRQIAQALNAEGFDAFRFDYSGTGDSCGTVADFGVGDWVTDIGVAAQELRELARVSELSIVGRQLGCVLAARAAKQGLAVNRIVMWEPVVDGSVFIDELEEAHRRSCMGRLQPYSEGETPWTTMLGFPFPQSLRRELAQITLPSELAASDTPVSVLVAKPEATPPPSYLRFKDWVQERGKLSDFIEMSDVPKFEPGLVLEGIVPAGPVPLRIVEQLSRQSDSESLHG